jgi:rubrerythrin
MEESQVRLRHVIETGIAIESQGSIFYEGLAENAEDQKAQDLFYRLSKAELRHKAALEKILSQWVQLPRPQEVVDMFERELKDRGVFAEPPSKFSSEEDAVKYAIDQERKMADFYRSFGKFFPDPWKLAHLTEMIMEEMKHMAELVALYPHLKVYAKA